MKMRDDEIALEHAWRYFQYHAEQRITVFNFFVATAGLLVTGLAFTVQAPTGAWALGLAAGLLLMLISLVFWRLDQRVSSMIKLAEQVVVQAETQLISDPSLRMISSEQAMTAGTKFGLFSAWTYGRAFRVIFFSMAFVGLLGTGFSAYRAFVSGTERSTKPYGKSLSQSTAANARAERPSPSPSQPAKQTAPSDSALATK